MLLASTQWSNNALLSKIIKFNWFFSKLPLFICTTSSCTPSILHGFFIFICRNAQKEASFMDSKVVQLGSWSLNMLNYLLNLSTQLLYMESGTASIHVHASFMHIPHTKKKISHSHRSLLCFFTLSPLSNGWCWVLVFDYSYRNLYSTQSSKTIINPTTRARL